MANCISAYNDLLRARDQVKCSPSVSVFARRVIISERVKYAMLLCSLIDQPALYSGSKSKIVDSLLLGHSYLVPGDGYGVAGEGDSLNRPVQPVMRRERVSSLQCTL